MHRHALFIPGRTWTLVFFLTGFFLLFLDLLDALQPLQPSPQKSRSVQAATSDTISLIRIADNLDKPVAITHAGDGSGRLFIALQDGRILIFDGNRILPEPFLNISISVSCCGDLGLLGLAFHPDYADNGFFYVYYTNLKGNSVVAAYGTSSDPNLADPNSASLILEIAQPTLRHNGGQLEFGPDGLLYIGTGDGSLGGDPDNNAQDLGSLLGKILRLDVDHLAPYGIPPDNPFVGVPGARAEIWAFGLRNPWRFSFDRVTGDLFIADVGQARWEEINFQASQSLGGENYGWRRKEGDACFYPPVNCDDGTLTAPIVSYSHAVGCAVTGGYRYRGRQMTSLVGTYVYGDFCHGQVWGAIQHADGSWHAAELLDTELSISTFGEDEDGELYVAHYAAVTGAVYRLASADETDPGSSGGWSRLPQLGQTLSGPEAVFFAGELWVFIRGMDDRVYFSVKTADGWTDLFEVPGNISTPSAPAATVWNGSVYLFIRDPDNRILYTVGTPQGWTDWQEVPGHGLTPSAPTAVAWNGALQLFVRGIDNRIYQNVFDGQHWSGWSEVPDNGLTLSGPRAAVYENALILVVRGIDNRIYDTVRTAAGWIEWFLVPGNGLTPSRPGVSVSHDGLDYLVRGIDSRTYHNRFVNGAWTGWQEMPGEQETLSGPAAYGTISTLTTVVRGTDNRVYIKHVD